MCFHCKKIAELAARLSKVEEENASLITRLEKIETAKVIKAEGDTVVPDIII